MASISSHPTLVCLFLSLSLISFLPQSATATLDSAQNIETFFPPAAQPPPPPPRITTTDVISLPPLLPSSPAPQPSSASSQSSTNSSQIIILAAVVSSVATTLAVSALFFLYVQIRSSPRRREEKRPMPITPEAKPVDGRERRVLRGREILRYGKSKSTSKVLDIESVERVQELPLLPSDVRRSHLQHPLAGEGAIGALPKSSSAPEATRSTSTTSSPSPILPDAPDHHALFTNNKTTEKSKEFNSDDGDDTVLSTSGRHIGRSQRPPPSLLPLPLPPSMVAKRILASMAVPPPPSSTSEEGEEHIVSTTPSRLRTSLPLPPKPPSTPSKMMEKVALPAPPPPAPPPPPQEQVKQENPMPPPAPPPPPLKVSKAEAAPPPPQPPRPPQPPLKVSKAEAAPPPQPPRPPPPPLKVSKAEAAPPPQPPRPPPPLRRNGSSSSTTSRQPPPERKLGRQRNKEQSMGKEAGIALKPLHWDKMTPDSDHSMVWDNIGDGSFRVNDDLIASLFGNVPPKQHQKSAFHAQEINKHSSASTSANHGILDPRRSQNIAIVLRSLSVRRQDIIDAVKDGHGLSSDTLDKIRKIAPNNEEHAQLLEFAGDDSSLLDAEAFLRRLITTVPSAFRRLDSMHFVSTFDQELANVKGSIQSMEMACKELRSSGLFVKLLEVVLKAGNRMNAGTARGNARAFNLNALKKLSDVKSIDGKTTLLHFVVQELVRSEGKKCALLNHDSISEAQEEREQEYVKLGLPVIGGLSVELGNVKKAAAVDYASLVGSSSSMAAGVGEVKGLLDGTLDDQNERDGFVREMRKFVLKAEEEMRLIREEEKRVLDLVNRTYEYYQPGVFKEKGSQPMQLFVIVKDFLGLVDQACVDIARIQQQKRKKALAAMARRASPEGLSDPSPVKLSVLPPISLLGSKFMITSSSSDSEEGF